MQKTISSLLFFTVACLAAIRTANAASPVDCEKVSGRGQIITNYLDSKKIDYFMPMCSPDPQPTKGISIDAARQCAQVLGRSLIEAPKAALGFDPRCIVQEACPQYAYSQLPQGSCDRYYRAVGMTPKQGAEERRGRQDPTNFIIVPDYTGIE